jgi:zinc transporter
MKTDYNDPCFVFGVNLADGPSRSDDFVPDKPNSWLHIDYSVKSSGQWLESLGLEEWVVNTLVRADSRPRTVVSNKGVLVVLRGINMNPESDPEDMVSLRIWLEPDRVITVRQRRLMSVQDVRAELEEGVGPTNGQELMLRLIEKISDRIAAFVDEIEEHIDQLETRVETDRDSETRGVISENRRRMAGVRRFLAPQRDALESLYRHAVTEMDSASAYFIREQTDRIVRYVEDLDLVRERLLVLQEDLMNLLMEEQNSRMYALSIVAVIFLPITFVSGVFGMNVAGLPGLEDANAFTFVAGSMVAMTGIVIGLLMLKRWL